MPLITVRELGKVGRFGNQLFLYVFAKAYASAMGCDLETPDWIGKKLFINAIEPPISKILVQTELDSISRRPLLYFAGHRDIDINVYAQHQVYLDYYTRAQVREWLKLKPEYDRPMNGAYSAAHMRRGDYSDPAFRKLYCTVSEESYDIAIDQHRIPTPVGAVSEASGRPWLEDFLTLRNATHLLRANSTFSWWAGTLGHGKVYAPVVGDKVGINNVEFVEGNHPCTAGKFVNQSDLYLKDE